MLLKVTLEIDTLDVNLRILQLLPETGVEADSTFKDETPLTTTIKSKDNSRFLGTRIPISMMTKKPLAL